MRTLLFIGFLLTAITGSAQHKAISVIFDSDMGPDYDDVGAIAILHAFADRGGARILATVASTNYDNVAAVFSVLNTYFNQPNIPIGVPKGKAVSLRDNQHWSDSLLANYPHAITTNSEAKDATILYRKILAAQADKSVTIISVGFFTNLANLLQSGPDSISTLNGAELVRKKVARLVSMAGKFPEGTEFNIEKDAAAAQLVFQKWPTQIICSGFEIGEKIHTGLPLVQNTLIQNSPVKDVFRISIPLAAEDSAGRKSWDETAVLVAIAGTAPYYDLQEGRVSVAADGRNTWKPGKGNHFILLEKLPPKQVEILLNQLMLHQPLAQ